MLSPTSVDAASVNDVEQVSTNRSSLDPRATVTGFVFRVRATGAPERLVRIKTPKCVIGSRPDCTLRLKGQGVAPVNCLLVRQEHGAMVRRIAGDVRINGLEVREAPLGFGQELSVGRFRFELLKEDMLAAASATPQHAASPPRPALPTPAAVAPPAAAPHLEPTANEPPSPAEQWRGMSGDPQAMTDIHARLADSELATKRDLDAVRAELVKLTGEFEGAAGKLAGFCRLFEDQQREERAWRIAFDAWRTDQTLQVRDLAARCHEIAAAVDRLTCAVETAPAALEFVEPQYGLENLRQTEAGERLDGQLGQPMMKEPGNRRGGNWQSTEPIQDSAPDDAKRWSGDDASDDVAAPLARLGDAERPRSAHDANAADVTGHDAPRRGAPRAGSDESESYNLDDASVEDFWCGRPNKAPKFEPVSDAAPVSTAALFGQGDSSLDRSNLERPGSMPGGPDDRPHYNPWATGGFHATPDVPFRTHEAGGAPTEDEHQRTVREYVAGLLRRSGGAGDEGDEQGQGSGEGQVPLVRKSAKWAEPKGLPRRAEPASQSNVDSLTAAEAEPTTDAETNDDDISPRELKPRTKAPEKECNLAAMRELARDNAKAALSTHARKQRAERVQVWLIGSLTSLAMSFVFMWLSTSGSALHYGGAVLFLAVAVGLGMRYLMLSKKEHEEPASAPLSPEAGVSAEEPKATTAETA